MAMIVVTGLPRSGTSMMMRALEAGGICALKDEIRVADSDNPNGYYEFEAVKNTRNDASWIEGNDGKAVKMVYRLIYDLPPTTQYELIVMRREMSEILASQAKMLDRLGFDKGPDDSVMEQLFERELGQFGQWVEHQNHVTAIEVWYGDVIDHPRLQFDRIQSFLGKSLMTQAMEDFIDPSLYRNRARVE